MTCIEEEKIIKYIVLTLMEGIGPVSHNALLDMCGDIGRCFDMEAEELIKANATAGIGIDRIVAMVRQRECSELRRRAKGIFAEAVNRGIDLVVREDARYPQRFIGLSDVPIVLYTKGSLRINEFDASVGIVGARRCTMPGKERTIAIACDAVRRNAAIISGMAKGVDSYAHTAAIKSGGYTIAVLGNGADICYPKEHARLYEEIGRHGCIVSEYPPGMQPRQYNFPRRNRLIAALSDRLEVIDAGRNSGTRSTVKYASKYRKEIIFEGGMPE